MGPQVGAGTLVVEGVSPSESPPSRHGSHVPPQLGGHEWGLEEGDVPPRSLSEKSLQVESWGDPILMYSSLQ